MSEEAPPPRDRSAATPTGPGLADLFAPVALVFGSLGVMASVLCCFDELRDDELIVAIIAIICIGVWSGAYGLVMRGTVPGRLGAIGGLLLSFLAIVLGFFALCWHQGLDL